jgi:hypothetical protein
MRYADLARPVSLNCTMSGIQQKHMKSLSYTAHGAPDVMRLNGDAMREHYVYDLNRLQMSSLTRGRDGSTRHVRFLTKNCGVRFVEAVALNKSIVREMVEGVEAIVDWRRRSPAPSIR